MGGKPFSYLCESKSKVASVSYSFSLAEDQVTHLLLICVAFSSYFFIFFLIFSKIFHIYLHIFLIVFLIGGLGHPFTANLCRFFLIFPHIFSHIFSNIFFFFTNHIFLFDKSHFWLVKHICFCWIIFVSWTNHICGRILDRQIGANCGSADFFAPYV